MSALKIIECPRDAMQGITEFIPTQTKIDYLNLLLKCSFDTLDFGSFVSPKAIPQMQDTSEVLAHLDLENTKTKLLAIIANEKGAENACSHKEIDYLGFPFSLSETFQQRNTNSSMLDAFKKIDFIQNLAHKTNKKLVVYLSMGFGNPYGDEWNTNIVEDWSGKLNHELKIEILALSDTIGCANPELVNNLFSNLIPSLPSVEFGAHLHTKPEDAIDLINAAYSGGCLRFDGAIRGFGGCPMAKDDLTGNMPTEKILEYFSNQKNATGIDQTAFDKAFFHAGTVFPLNH